MRKYRVNNEFCGKSHFQIFICIYNLDFFITIELPFSRSQMSAHMEHQNICLIKINSKIQAVSFNLQMVQLAL